MDPVWEDTLRFIWDLNFDSLKSVRQYFYFKSEYHFLAKTLSL